MSWRVAALLLLSGCAIGPTYSIPKSDDLSSNTGAKFTIGSSTYLWAAYDDPGLTLLGQRMGSAEIISGGVGGRINIVRNLHGFAELGWHEVSTDPPPHIRDEAVARALVNQFGDNTFEHTSYSLGDGYGARFGFEYQRLHWSITGGYRYLRVDEDLDAWNGEAPVLGDPKSNWWQTRGSKNLGAVEIGALWRF